MNLFICTSSLQILIAKAIINKLSIKLSDCEFFVFSEKSNLKIKHYFDKVSALCGEANFMETNLRFPFYVLDIQKRFRGKKYSSIYLASIDSLYIQIILSIVNFDKLNTFDDGTANIVEAGIYNRHSGDLSIFRMIWAYLVGGRFNQNKIKKNSVIHYTIFKNKKNYSSECPVHVEIFNKFGNTKVKKFKCMLILGTDLLALCSIDRVQKLEKITINVASNRDFDVFYLPHPRGKPINALEKITLHTRDVAEDVVANLLDEYEYIDVYSFCSSAQFNFNHVENINNYIILADCLNKPIAQVQYLALQDGMSSINGEDYFSIPGIDPVLKI
ncbi:beta-galactosamide-alpha-2,3-sialyltransferase [Polaromonas sp. CG_9.5]|uniref:glycosyltransferase family 52 n=1 Tax=Polaromonas sp. CG_9.5 TaxID=3071705 RepID=UPI002E07BC28|nr:beta-galactosamide-alpha-2,3-sialyltransferase [Polaromonas sp. CG_9.5]